MAKLKRKYKKVAINYNENADEYPSLVPDFIDLNTFNLDSKEFNNLKLFEGLVNYYITLKRGSSKTYCNYNYDDYIINELNFYSSTSLEKYLYHNGIL